MFLRSGYASSRYEILGTPSQAPRTSFTSKRRRTKSTLGGSKNGLRPRAKSLPFSVFNQRQLFRTRPSHRNPRHGRPAGQQQAQQRGTELVCYMLGRTWQWTGGAISIHPVVLRRASSRRNWVLPSRRASHRNDGMLPEQGQMFLLPVSTIVFCRGLPPQ